MKVNGTYEHLGCYGTAEEAALVFAREHIRLHGTPDMGMDEGPEHAAHSDHADADEESDEEGDSDHADASAAAEGSVFIDVHGHYIYVCTNDHETPLEVALRFSMRVGELLEMNRAWYLPHLRLGDVMQRGTHLWVAKQRSLARVPKLEWQARGSEYIGGRVRREFWRRRVGGSVVVAAARKWSA